MTRPEVIPQGTWDAIPPEAQAVVAVVVAVFEARIAELEARLEQSSSNSSRPPSSDPRTSSRPRRASLRDGGEAASPCIGGTTASSSSPTRSSR